MISNSDNLLLISYLISFICYYCNCYYCYCYYC